MAKDGKMSLPSVDDAKAAADSVRQDVELQEQIAKSTVAIEVADRVGYIPLNVDVLMTRAQARILRDKLRALQDAGAKTADGRFVDNRAQAVRWIIENEVVL
jgi:hypothetical protein